jgi:hypothetical protein
MFGCNEENHEKLKKIIIGKDVEEGSRDLI